MSTKSYVLNNTIQMIDINNDFKAFRTVYNITCDNLQDEFEYAIVPQKRLDENQFNFKKAIGYHEDSVTNTDANNIQDWYLVMRAEKDTPCKIVLDITSLDEDEVIIPPTKQLPPKQVRFQQQRQRPQSIRRRQPIISDSSSDSESDDEVEEKNTSKNWYKYIFIFLLLLLLILVVLWWTGYLYKLPYMGRFKPASTFITVAHSQVVSQPQVVQPQPPPPQLSIITEIPPPQTYAPDPNFINEMRELKIDL
jgi:hypothetical protein